MGIFDFVKDEKVLDLSKNSEQEIQRRTFPFREEVVVSKQEIIENINVDEKKRKLAKRITDILEKLDDLSTQIYHLQQRVEVLERKTNMRLE